MGQPNIIILSGGPSPEAEVSRSSSKGIFKACQDLGYTTELWELEGDWMARLAKLNPKTTFVFLGLHGAPGEDGTVQGVLELLGLPYNGSGVTASAVAVDKILTRNLLAQSGLPVAPGLSGTDLHENSAGHLLATHGKIVCKPATSGSSIGVSIVSSMQEWPAALSEATAYGKPLVEAFIPGQELTIPLLINNKETKVLPVVEITTEDNTWYDYTSKYAAGGSAHLIPARIPENIRQTIEEHAQKAAHALGCHGACRIDFRYDEASQTLVVLEVNTLPGLTPTSLLPDAAAHTGTKYAQLIDWMIKTGMERTQ